MSENDAARAAALRLLSAAAVRDRSAALFSRIAEGASEHFTVVPEALEDIAAMVSDLTRQRFADLAVPLHARWRHFEADGFDRFGSLAAARGWSTPEAAARAMGDLAVVSVLLDAGAGAHWRYRETATGRVYARSEGLAVASLAMFASGAFSGVPADPLRADAAALEAVSEQEFARGFQIGPDNPLAGVEGRRALLERLAMAVRAAPDLFASEDDPRPGGLVDVLAGEADDAVLPAPRILEAVLEGLGAVWPGSVSLGGLALGDTWLHPALGDGTPGSDLVPFHKLSLWLALSLVEPLSVRGIAVTDLDGLPGLAEYRNGGLFVDGGALVPRTKPSEPLAVGDPLVVEWRAATIALLDRLAPMVRDRLGAGAREMPLAAILEGGTWLAGRRLAAELRPDASPPIRTLSDGTVF